MIVSSDEHTHTGNCFDDAWNANGDGLRPRCDDHPQFARGACSDCPDCMACFDESFDAAVREAITHAGRVLTRGDDEDGRGSDGD